MTFAPYMTDEFITKNDKYAFVFTLKPGLSLDEKKKILKEFEDMTEKALAGLVVEDTA